MRVSEKSLELNVGAELLSLIRTDWGMPRAYLRGLTQAEEAKEGVDFFVQLDSQTRIFAFQFKAPRGHNEHAPYRYKLVGEQHAMLHNLAQKEPGAVLYVFPFYVTPAKLQQDVPHLLNDTWTLRVADVPTAVFNGYKTRVIHCFHGTVSINPEYTLTKVEAISAKTKIAGIEATQFARWYEGSLRGIQDVQETGAYTIHRNPWLVRGLRIVVVPPSG